MGAAATKESKHYAAFEASLPSLQGKTVAITGCTTGTGYVTAVCAARKGADHVLLLNRVSERSTAAEEAIRKEIAPGSTTKVETIPCDLQDLDSVQQAADAIKSKYSQLHVLCNNAGVMALEDVATKDGYDVQMQTNHLSHFLLTKELFPLLSKTSRADEGDSGGDVRIVFHSSIARRGGPLKPEYFGKNGGNLGGNGSSMIFNGARWERYHQTKLANAVMTAALADKLKASTINTKIKAVCAAPGFAQTNLQVTSAEKGGMGNSSWMMHFSQSSEDGAIPLLTACFHPSTANGDFYEPKNGIKGLPVKTDFDKHAKSMEQQKLLWDVSEAACGTFPIIE